MDYGQYLGFSAVDAFDEMRLGGIVVDGITRLQVLFLATDLYQDLSLKDE